MTDFDTEGVFGEDYLRFYVPLLTDQRSETDVETIRQLAGIGQGTRVLDAPCGHGRIANRLARDGARVSGIDITELFLNRARRQAVEWDVRVDYQHGDLLAMEIEGEFDVVVNWFTSFGYWDDDQCRSVLRRFAQALVPGGALVMELNNRDRLMRAMLDVTVAQDGNDFMIDRHRYDATASRLITERTTAVGAERRTTTFTVRLFTATELRDWLLAVGFADVEVFGDDLDELTRDSRRMLVRATRAASP